MTSNWAGFTQENPRREIREPSLVQPKNMLELLDSIGEPAVVVNDKRDLGLFVTVFGGNGLIESELCKKHLPWMLKPTVCSYSFDGGFDDLDSIDKAKLDYAPSRKVRMNVLNRDQRRCMICGCRPSDNVHVRLELHHIQPFAKGGLTEENNLVTLCNACHSEVGPGIDYSLYASIGIGLLSKLEKKPYHEQLEKNVRLGLSALRQKQKFKSPPHQLKGK